MPILITEGDFITDSNTTSANGTSIWTNRTIRVDLETTTGALTTVGEIIIGPSGKIRAQNLLKFSKRIISFFHF